MIEAPYEEQGLEVAKERTQSVNAANQEYSKAERTIT